MDTLKIRVAHFELCTATTCSFKTSSLQHLVIHTQTVDLEEKNAVAISYGWGATQRRRRSIGHHATDEALPVEMCLGGEWEEPDFVIALHSICAETGQPCWIDQISLVQTDDDAIRVALARIPEIYRTLHVVALLPGAICECKLPGAALENLGFVERTGCWNNISLLNYFGRLWPRQELQYARQLQARWTSSRILRCPEGTACHVAEPGPKSTLQIWELAKTTDHLSWMAKHIAFVCLDLYGRPDETLPSGDEDDWDQLGTQINTAYDETAERVYAKAAYQMSMEVISTYDAAASSLAIWEDLHIADAVPPGEDREGILLQFLRGETLTETLDNRNLTDQQRLYRFLRQISVIGSERRFTTQDQDLVLAIWPDCPRYRIPSDYRIRPLPDLLEDAMLQLEQKWGVSFVTYQPSGLFTGSELQNVETALLWRPTKTVPPINLRGGNLCARSTSDVYNGLCSGACYYSVRTNSVWSIPVLCFNKTVPARHFDDFELFCAAKPSARTLFQLLHIALERLPEHKIERMMTQGFAYAYSEDLQDELLIFLKAHRDMRKAREEVGWRPLREGIFQKVENIDFPRLAYWIICRCCGIATNVARTCGLRLIMNRSPGPNYARLGLFRVGAEVLNTSRTSTISGTGTGFITDQSSKLEWAPPTIEVSLQDPEEHSAVRSDYEVLGVWAPLRIVCAGDRLHISQGYLPTLGHNALSMSEDYLTSQKFLSDLQNAMSDYIAQVEEARAQSRPDNLMSKLMSWPGYDDDIWAPLERHASERSPD